MKLLLALCLAAGLAGCNQYDPYNPDTTNLQGVWALDNTKSRKVSEPPVWKRLSVYATHMEFSPGQGTVGTEGEWKNDGFWCEAKNKSGKFEAVHVLDDERVELNLAAFYPENREVLILYKERGSDEEMRKLAADYPQSITYPPPAGAIPVGMPEYRLLALPWKADRIMPAVNAGLMSGNPAEAAPDKADDAAIYCYHSDNAQLAELRVTVKNHRVTAINGGNG